MTGGRIAGHGRSSDGLLEVDLRTAPELGGEGDGTNPEQLFAVGYAACFESALAAVARRRKLEVDDVEVDSKVMLVTGEERSFTIAVELGVTVPSVEQEAAIELVEAAHKVCPYSTRPGNLEIPECQWRSVEHEGQTAAQRCLEQPHADRAAGGANGTAARPSNGSRVICLSAGRSYTAPG